MKTNLLLLLGLLLTTILRGAERTWTGAGGNNLWSNPNNWSPAGPPQDGDDLSFFNLCPFVIGCPAFTVVNDLSNLRVGELRFGDSASGSVEYVVNGNPLRLTEWVLIGIASGDDTPRAVVTLNCPVVLENDTRFQVAYGGWGGFPNDGRESRLFLNGAINLNGHDLDVILEYNLQDSRSRVDIAGTISGAGNVFISARDGCTAQFNGAADNTFTGTLTFAGTFDQEKFVLNKTGGAVTHGRLVIGGVCRWERPHQIGDQATVLVTDRAGLSAGKLYLQGYDETFQNLEFEELDDEGGIEDCLIDTGGGVLTILSHIRTESDRGTPVIRGRLAVPSDVTLDINGTEFYGLDLPATISGAGDITKTGNAALILSGNNTFTQWLFIEGGSVEPRHANALGSVNRGVSLRGGSLRLINLAIGGESLYSQADNATLFSLGTATWAGEIRLERHLQIYGENFTHAHVITGPGGLALLGGTITLTDIAHNTFTGPTEVRCELLRLNKPSNTRAFSGPLIVGGGFAPLHEVRWLNNFQFPAAAQVTLHPNSLLAFNDFTDIASNLTFNGGHVNLATDSALQITGLVTANPTNTTALVDGATGLGSLFLSGPRTFNVGDGSIIGPDLRIDARIAGGGITKIGEGTLALGGNNAFGGAVVISNGLVRVDHDNGLGTTGAGTTVRSGATLFLANAADLVREPVTLSGAGFGGTNGALQASGAVVLSNNVVLASPSTIRVDSPWQLKIDGVISGTGPLTKIGGGALTFAGPANNTFTGDTLVNAGTLQLDKSDFLQAVPGNLVIGAGGLRSSAATVRHFSQDQIWANTTVNANGLLDLNGFEEYLLTLTLNEGGDVQTGGGLLTVDAGNSITVNPGTGLGASTISGRLGLRTGNHNITVGSSVLGLGGGLELDIPAQVLFYNGIANIHKNGPGDMRLGGANTFTGVLYVDGGRVIAANNSALGATQGSTVVRTNGALVLDGGITTGDFLILDSATFPSLVSVNGTNVATNGVNLIRPNNGLDVQPVTGVLQVRGRVGSVGGLTKLGPGTLQFFGPVANDYAGLTVISNGVIEASRGNVLLGQSAVSIPGEFMVGDDTSATTMATLRLLQPGQVKPDADATLHRSGWLDLVPRMPLPNTSARLRTVTGAGKINLGAGTSLAISNDVSFTFSGAIHGSGALNKRGRDTTVHMTGDSPFAGPTTIVEGYYQMDGSASNSPVTIKPDAALNGDGILGDVTVEANGLVFPVSAVPGRYGGDLAMRSVNFSSGGLLGLNLWGARPTGTNESLIVNGPVTLNNAELISDRFLYAPKEGDVITLIHKRSAGPISGTFNGYPQGAPRVLGGIPVVMSYTGGDGNDVTLTVSNLALAFASWRVESGNGNGLIEPDECNLFAVALRNRRGNSLPVTSAVLRSLTSDAIVTMAQSDYPAFAPTSIRTNLTPFQVRTLPSLPCGTAVPFELQVSVPGEGTFAIPFQVSPGFCVSGGGGCESCTVVTGQFTTNSLRTTRVPDPIGASSECLPPKPCPGSRTLGSAVGYAAHAFTNATGANACITAQLHHNCPTAPVGALHVAAYLDRFTQQAACSNYLADAGAAGPDNSPPFSFTVPAGARFEVVVMQLTEVLECPSYWVEVFGLPCPPPRLEIAADAASGHARLHWSTAYPDWSLQSVTSLRSPGSNDFANVLTTPVVVNGRYTVTNTTVPPRQFFRLIR